MSEAAPARPDVTAAANTLRDTVKWLAAAFAGTAALVIGNSPLSGLGQLPLWRWVLALLALALGFGLICLALWRTLRILKPDALYRSDLLGTHDKLRTPEERKELEALRAVIDARGADLLPHNARTLKAVAKALKQIKAALKKAEKPEEGEEEEEEEENDDNDDEAAETGATAEATADEEKEEEAPLGPEDIQELKDTRAAYHKEIAKVLPFAQYLRLQHRFEQEQPWMAGLSSLALLCLVLFNLAATPPEKDPAPISHPIIIQNHCPGPCGDPKPPTAALPALPAVLFAHDKAILTPEGEQAIQTARDEMQKHPRALLLVQAHTDTTGPTAHNADLARRRALAVLPLLSSQGGIAPDRLLVAYLPETALPRVTPDERRDAQNRSVRLLMIEDTRR